MMATQMSPKAKEAKEGREKAAAVMRARSGVAIPPSLGICPLTALYLRDAFRSLVE